MLNSTVSLFVGSEKHGYVNPLPSSPAKSEVPSLYRSHRPPGGGTGQEVQQNSGNTGNKLGMFNFGDDVRQQKC